MYWRTEPWHNAFVILKQQGVLYCQPQAEWLLIAYLKGFGLLIEGVGSTNNNRNPPLKSFNGGFFFGEISAIVIIVILHAA